LAAAGIDDRARTDAAHRSAVLQTDMWRLAVAQAVRNNRSPVVQIFFMEALNDTIDESDKEEAVFARGSIPPDADRSSDDADHDTRNAACYTVRHDERVPKVNADQGRQACV